MCARMSRSSTMRNEIDVSFGDITKENINHLRKMNASLFPVRYPESFYADVPLSNPDFNQYAYVNGAVVGAMCCGIGSPDKSGTHEQLNIMILGVLATWRRRGIGTQLLHRILTKLEQYPSVGEVYLHVQTSNDEAIRFYQENGFTIEETIVNYYKRVYPPDCYILRKKVFDGA